MRLFQAIAVFFKVLLQADFAVQVEQLASAPALPAPTGTTDGGSAPATSKTTAAPSGTGRSDAITLLATLQREARFVDIVMEPLGEYSDAQVGAATRDVLRDCGQTLERLFGIQPVLAGEEGSMHETPTEVDPARYRLTGSVAGQPPYRGQVVHHGWEATRCELPTWSGSKDATLLVAPVELSIS